LEYYSVITKTTHTGEI